MYRKENLCSEVDCGSEVVQKKWISSHKELCQGVCVCVRQRCSRYQRDWSHCDNGGGGTCGCLREEHVFRNTLCLQGLPRPTQPFFSFATTGKEHRDEHRKLQRAHETPVRNLVQVNMCISFRWIQRRFFCFRAGYFSFLSYPFFKPPAHIFYVKPLKHDLFERPLCCTFNPPRSSWMYQLRLANRGSQRKK